MKRVIGLVAAALIMAAAPASAQTYRYTLGGFSPGGLASLLGVGIDRAVQAEFPGSTITYQPSGGGFANVALLDQNKVQLGLAHSAEVLAAQRGQEPFRAPVEGMRALARLYNWAPMHVLVTKEAAEEHDLKSFDDIIAKKVPLRFAVNRPGNIVEQLTERMFEAAGASFEDVAQWGGQIVHAASEEQVDLMRDRRVDVVMNNLFVGQRPILEISQARDVVLLPISEKVIEKVSKELGATPHTIQAGSYDFLDREVPSMSLSLLLVADESLDEQAAYDITKAIAGNIGELQSVAKAMNVLTPAILASEPDIAYHPGALRYYKEAGLK